MLECIFNRRIIRTQLLTNITTPTATTTLLLLLIKWLVCFYAFLWRVEYTVCVSCLLFLFVSLSLSWCCLSPLWCCLGGNSINVEFIAFKSGLAASTVFLDSFLEGLLSLSLSLTSDLLVKDCITCLRLNSVCPSVFDLAIKSFLFNYNQNPACIILMLIHVC